jgi:hypothetical protein
MMYPLLNFRISEEVGASPSIPSEVSSFLAYGAKYWASFGHLLTLEDKDTILSKRWQPFNQEHRTNLVKSEDLIPSHRKPYLQYSP